MGVCRTGAMPAVGFPAGLIAAQSIGERGTQLSMQSFHTGERAFTISDARRLLGHGDDGKFFEDADGGARFVADWKACDVYTSLQDRHFHVLWRVIQAVHNILCDLQSNNSGQCLELRFRARRERLRLLL